MNIQIIDRSPYYMSLAGPHMAGMPLIPSEPQPELPEFAFSPKVTYLSRTAACAGCGMGIHEAKGERNHHYFGHDGPYCPPCAVKWQMHEMGRNVTFDHPKQKMFIGPAVPATLHNRVTGGPVEGLSTDEIAWRQYKPTLGRPAKHTKPPVGTTVALGALGTFLDRVAEIEAIAKTQNLELPTVGQEMAQCGISSYDLQSSSASDDDSWTVEDEIDFFTKAEGHVPTEEEIADIIQQHETDLTNEEMNEIEHDARRYGTPYAVADYAEVVRHIEWERFFKGCHPTTPRRIWLQPKDDLSGVTIETNSKMVTTDDLKAAAPILKALLDGRTASDLNNDLRRVEHYGKIGSCLYGAWAEDALPEQSMDQLGMEDHPLLRESNGAPQELGLHTVFYGQVDPEPTPQELWPDDYPAQWVAELLPTDPDPSWLPDNF